MARPTCLFAIALGALLFAGGSVHAGQDVAPPAASEVIVWALRASRVYHCPGSNWYGQGGGINMPECRAIRDGYKPALGAGCGSGCPR